VSCNPRVFSDFIDAETKWDAYVAVDPPVWAMILVAVILPVWAYAVAKTIARDILVLALSPRHLTFHA